MGSFYSRIHELVFEQKFFPSENYSLIEVDLRLICYINYPY